MEQKRLREPIAGVIAVAHDPHPAGWTNQSQDKLDLPL
jgi:hypothetical protein